MIFVKGRIFANKQKKALAQKIEPMPILYPSVFLGIFQSPPLQSGVGLY